LSPVTYHDIHGATDELQSRVRAYAERVLGRPA
jgi:hypothetical protein